VSCDTANRYASAIPQPLCRSGRGGENNIKMDINIIVLEGVE
jgi:hypothetical protein